MVFVPPKLLTQTLVAVVIRNTMKPENGQLETCSQQFYLLSKMQHKNKNNFLAATSSSPFNVYCPCLHELYGLTKAGKLRVCSRLHDFYRWMFLCACQLHDTICHNYNFTWLDGSSTQAQHMPEVSVTCNCLCEAQCLKSAFYVPPA